MVSISGPDKLRLRTHHGSDEGHLAVDYDSKEACGFMSILVAAVKAARETVVSA